MGAASSVDEERQQPIRGGPSRESSPPDDAQLQAYRAALKNANPKQGESRRLKAAALGMCTSLGVSLISTMSVRTV